jgi:PknH-like extracellular domain
VATEHGELGEAAVRQQVAVLVLAGMSTLAIACTTTVSGKAVPGDNSGPLTRNPVTVSALDGLLLDIGHIDMALGATSMKVWFDAKAMWDWSSSVNDKNCLAIDGPAQDKVYANTGWTAMRGQRLDDSVDDSKKRKNYAIQAVVAYPSAHEANAFYESSAQSWAACSKRRYSDIAPNQPDTVWTVSDITTDNGTLSTTQVQEAGDGWTCQRALTVRNNVAIDIVTCTFSQSGSPAVDIASQIAAKVAKQ